MTSTPKQIDTESIDSAPLLNIEGLAQDIGRTVVVAPHPDDEALGCSGLIKLLRSQNTEVHIVFTTNGGASHPNSTKFNCEKLQLLRQNEALKSCLTLGVKEEFVHFIGLKDSKLNASDQNQKNSFVKKLTSIFQLCKFDSIVTTWRRDAHNDHRETYKLCADFVKHLGRPIQMIEFPIWMWKNGKPEDWPYYEEVEPFRVEIESVKDSKEQAIYKHTSQTTKLINDDPHGFILTDELLAPFLGNFEYYFFTLDSNRPSLDQNYFKKLYNESIDPWDFRSSPYERKKYLKTLEYLKYYRFKNALELGCSIGEHSNLLARHCDKLTAIDISKEAIESAKRNFSDKNIEFKVWNASNGLPQDIFDLVTVCEVGYYLNKKDLTQLYLQIDEQLQINGFILLVHWTSYVRDYPLAGKQVHRIFETLDFVESRYMKKEIYQHKKYELVLWQKVAK